MAFAGFEVNGDYTEEKWVKVYIDFDTEDETEQFYENTDGNPEFGHELGRLVERFMNGEEQ